MKYVIELFNPYAEPNIDEFDTEEKAREFLKSELQKTPNRGWELQKIEILDGSDIIFI